MLLKEIERCYSNKEKMEDFLHEKALKLYRIFLCIGGMPEAIKNFIENKKDILVYEKRIINNIVLMYLADMNKYTYSQQESVKIEKLYKNISSQLALEKKKFTFANIEEHAKKAKYETALDWLVASNLALKCNDVKVPNIPLEAYKEDNIYKVYLSDIGILCSICKINFSSIVLNEPFRYKGAITENYVATEFKAKEIELYYWTSQRNAKVDFILTDGSDIIPIEVKSSDNVKSKSLVEYIKKNNPKYAVRLSTKNFGFENNIKSIPLYATFCLCDEIKKNY